MSEYTSLLCKCLTFLLTILQCQSALRDIRPHRQRILDYHNRARSLMRASDMKYMVRNIVRSLFTDRFTHLKSSALSMERHLFYLFAYIALKVFS